MMHRSLLFLFLVFLGRQVVCAQELSASDAAALEKRFLQAQRGTRTMEVAFRQTFFSKGLRNPVASEGFFYFRAPDELVVQYSRPAGDFYHLKGEGMQSSRRGKRSGWVGVDTPSARPLASLRDMLGGRSVRDAGLFERTVTREGDAYVVLIKPRVPAPDMPASIENQIEASTMSLRSMKITLPSGSGLLFEFSGFRQNGKLDEAVFSK